MTRIRDLHAAIQRSLERPTGSQSLTVLYSKIILTAILWLFSTTSQAAHGYFLQLGLGAAEQKDIHTLHNDLTLDAAMTFAGEIGMFVTENTALGVRLSFHDNDNSDARADWPHRKIVRWKINTNLYEAALRASIWIPRQSGVILGGGAGIGHFTSDTGVGSARRTATAPIFEVFSGFQHTFSNEFMMHCRFGYAHRDFGWVEAKYGHTSSDPRDINLSGWFVEIGLGGHTNRPWNSTR
ncbi:MAG: outer membrane beta-barrel protein [Candidatus Latescibacterota bacterium]|nr:MAG: outer membrane beta-barrel protein [Candidatus Latescibacterota bacterium]